MDDKATHLPPALGRVIVVEDDVLVAMAIEDALLAGGAEHVVLCSTIARAMTELERERPNAIILDVHLADRNDGWALAELVNAIGGRTPRIIFSTATPDAIPPEIARLGDILAKPYEPDRLVALLHRQRGGLLSRIRDAMN